MALIKCKNCGNFISDKAKACPKCGAPNIPSPSETNEDTKFQSEEKENTSHAINPEANSPHQEDNHFDPDQDPKPSHKKLYILLAILIILIAGGIGYYFYAQHQNKLEESRWEAKRIEQLRQDSIEAARIEAERIEAARLDSIRQDSIKRIAFLNNFTCNIFIKVNHKKGYPWEVENSNWSERLKAMGFVKGTRKMTYQGAGDYDGSNATLYETKYTYGEGNEKVSVTFQNFYAFDDCYKKESEAQHYWYNLRDWKISFSSLEQLEAFEKSLKRFGYRFDSENTCYHGLSAVGSEYLWFIDRKRKIIYTDHSQG